MKNPSRLKNVKNFATKSASQAESIKVRHIAKNFFFNMLSNQLSDHFQYCRMMRMILMIPNFWTLIPMKNIQRQSMTMQSMNTLSSTE